MDALSRTIGSTALLALVLWPSRIDAQSADAQNVIDRATKYVRQFVDGFVNVVAEERYVQTASPNNPGPGPRRRVLLSDFLLVKGETGDWHQFRDVREVDGRPVADRDRRLTELFLQPWSTAIQQAARIANDGARYNLVNVGAINVPLVAMALFQPYYRERIELSVGRLERDGGQQLRVISFRESLQPSTIIGGGRATGQIWVDEATGRIMKTVLELRSPGRKFAYTITTSFVFDERLQLAVPAEMRDSYPSLLDMTGVATYGNFRSFQVRTTEEVR